MPAARFERPHSMASSPLAMLSMLNPYGESSRLISSTVALSGSMHSRIRSAIGSPPGGGHTTRISAILRTIPLVGRREAGRHEACERGLVEVRGHDVAEAAIVVGRRRA